MGDFFVLGVTSVPLLDYSLIHIMCLPYFFTLWDMSFLSSARAKALALGSAAIAAGSALMGSSYAYTVDATTGFPVVEATDTSTMLSGVGSAVGGLLNFITSNWKVVIAIIVAGAIVGFVKYLMHKTGSATRGR